MLIAHAPISILINRVVNRDAYKKENTLLLDILAGLFGILPDFDFFYQIAFGHSPYSHHELISHTPIFWIIMYILMSLCFKYVYKAFKSDYRELITNYIPKIFITSILVHLITDLFTGNIMLVYPISNYGFTIFGQILPELLTSPFIHPIFILELSICLIWIYTMFKEYISINSYYLPTIKYTIIMTILSLFLFSSFFYINSYKNNLIPKKENNMAKYDIDNDMVKDSIDTDIDNNGVENIYEYREYKEEIIENARRIAQSGKYASNDSLSRTLGGINSVDLFNTSFAMSSLHVQPSVYNFANRHGVTVQNKEQYIETLYELLKEKGLVFQVNQIEQINSSDIFILRKGDEFINIGFILDDKYVATVLDTDRRLTKHRIENVLFKSSQIVYIYR